MKTNSIISGVAACLIAISLSACDKAKDSMEKATDAAGKAVDATKDAAGKGMDAAKDAVSGAMTNAVSSAMGPAGEAVAAAKKAIDEKNYQGALDALKKLDGVTLSPEQQKMVDEVKAQAMKLMGGATDAVKDAAGANGIALPK